MKARVLTAFGLMPLVLGAFFCASPYPLLLLSLIAALICTREAEKLLGRTLLAGVVLSWCLLFGGFALCFSTTGMKSLMGGGLSLFFFTLGVIATYIASTKKKGILSGLLVPLWFLTPIVCLNLLHQFIPTQRGWFFANPMLMAILPLWGGDTAGIFVGKAFGKRLLAPTISPKKTVEGAVGNLLACVGVAWLFGPQIGLTMPMSILCGLTAGIFGQVGDLFESFIKRQAGVKDSGNLLPGHGGLLDRIDSILFTAPLVLAVLLFCSFPELRTDSFFKPAVTELSLLKQVSRP